MAGIKAKSLGRMLLGTALLAAPIVLRAETTPLKVSGTEAVRGASKLAIGAFNLGFIFESVDQTAATGGMIGAFGSTTKAQSELVGVTPDMMQKITDAAYADFVAQLAKAGFAVEPAATMFAAPQMANPHGQSAPLDISIALEKGSKGKATYLKPTALPTLVLLPGDFTGTGFSSMGIAMSAGQAQGALMTYARAAGTPVIDVTYLIDFSQQKRPGSFSLGGISVNASLSVSSKFSRMTVLGANGKNSTVTLNQPIAVDGDFIEERDATSKTGKTTQAAANIFGGIMAAKGFGGMKFGKTRKFEFTAKPGNYEEGAIKAATLANERLVAQIAAMK
jgi:hypothetical protein